MCFTVWIAGCATPSERVPAGGARLSYVDLRRSTQISLASENLEPYRTQIAEGTLPRGLKLIPDSEMGELLGYIRERGFYDYALAVSPDDPALKGKTKAILVLETGGQWLTFPFASNPERDPGTGARVQSFVDIKNRISEIFQRTTQYAGVR